MIEARAIRKAYGANTVLDGASLTVRGGECVVLTGDNGSGKTTLLHVLVGMRHADEGEVLWKGRALTGAYGEWRQAREAWGFLPQQVGLPPGAHIGRLLQFHARVRGVDAGAAFEWLERVGLADVRSQRVASLSGGMQQRLGIALTLFFQPKLIIMDEPASSLDPGWRAALVDWVHEQARRGAAVLVASQLHEAWGTAARYAHCEQGRILDEGAEEAAAG